MTKITPEHLARTGIVYVRQSSPHQVANNLESQRRQYPSSHAGSSSVGATFKSSMTISVAPVMAFPGQVLKGCWRASAKAASALSSRLRRPGSRGTDEIGIRCWSSVDSLAL